MSKTPVTFGICLLIAIGGLAAACSQTNFAGRDANAEKPKASTDAKAEDGKTTTKKKDKPVEDLGSTVEPEVVEDIDEEEAEEEEPETHVDKIDCAKDPTKDAAETFVFPTMESIREFVKLKCKTPINTSWPTQGALREEAPTQAKICRLKGFKEATAFKTGDWSSPGDNQSVWWVEAEQKFKVKANSRDHNIFLTSLTCKGRLQAECSEELEQEDCDP